MASSNVIHLLVVHNGRLTSKIKLSKLEQFAAQKYQQLPFIVSKPSHSYENASTN